MKRIKVNISILLNCYVFHIMLFTAVASYPVQDPNLEMQPEIRDEKRFPNGTTIGKYTYMDNEGNPVQVKYYADEASYGVELKSIKVVDRGNNLFQSPSQSVQDSSKKLVKDSEERAASNILSTDSVLPLKYKNQEFLDPYDFLNKEVSKTNRYKLDKPDSDYDIFYQNELKADKKCSKDKVRVYYGEYGDKENRKVRRADNNLADADKFCEQFTN